ncbi:phage/plasmid replication protein [Mucilaginibacter sp. 5C4]|uniref:phage/plasmid replication domain-containing protein n=2 Tax=Mucilaginibacter sp. 5C4 TaxID=3048589 RepID=UPI002B233EE6|nr:phage/plasmid replication protein [Mucilaginibacter sp. 5C4]MEB0302870.1 hypothetical protein [Mucilaginibacter sp. 5C4]
MIDTILFKLNNVSKYPLTLTKFEHTTRTGETNFMVDKDTGECFENHKVRAILHHDSDSIIPLSKRAKLHIPSSNYNLSYFYNITQDFITFEFSIPKYMFGTNILQFIKYFKQDSVTIYNYLLDFVKGFFIKHTYDIINMADVELLRLDLCYNQFFNSKVDALRYLGEQKELLQKFAMSSKNKYRCYDSSFIYTTKRYSFKIYHKGEEFKIHDRKELAKKNPTGHSLKDLQEIADKVLRYEVTFRKAQIDYLFEKNELHTKYVSFLKNENARKSFRLTNRIFYDKCITFCEQSKHFVFAHVSQHDAIEKQTVAFDSTIFAVMFNFFWDIVKKYQLDRKTSLGEVKDKIIELNNKRDTATSKGLRGKLSYNNNMLMALTLLTEHTTLDELRRSGLFGRSSFFVYQKKLKELGITSNNRITDMAIPFLDYSDYQHYFGHHHLK